MVIKSDNDPGLSTQRHFGNVKLPSFYQQAHTVLVIECKWIYTNVFILTLKIVISHVLPILFLIYTAMLLLLYFFSI